MKKILKQMFQKIRNSIQLKIIVIYIMSLFVVYFVTWYVLSIFLFQPLEKEVLQNMEDSSGKISSNIRNTRENYDNILYRLSNNRDIYKALSEQCNDYEDVWEALTDIKYTLNEDMARTSIIKKLEVYQKGSDIGEDGKYVFSDGFNADKFENTNWMIEKTDDIMLLCKYQRVSSLYNNVEAYIKIAIGSQEAFAEATELEGDISGKVYLTNEKNNIIASSELDSIGNDISKFLPQDIVCYPDGEIVENNNIVVLKNLVDENWNVWLVLSQKQFDSKVKDSKAVVAVILLGYGICSGIALSLLLSKVFKRIHKLGEKMEQIQGNISYIRIPEKRDEVAVLEFQYNNMLEKLENVIDEMAEVKSEKQKFELKSLESQINPHFLYNTLGVMRWEALGSRNDKLVKMIDELTTFYRLSLNKGRGLLNIEQEVELVKAYINIQQIRWDNVVNVTVDMDSSVKSVIIPKMILQPLVENIWLHGNIIAEENRKIEVLVHDLDSKVEFRIWDNGDGIPEDVIREFNENRDVQGDSFGIGIQFIRNILKHYYGDGYVYEIRSEEQNGSLIRIELPKKVGVIK